jgi:hypothetical protein
VKNPIKRKAVKRHRVCPINTDSLYRRWARGDKRIDWLRIEKLLKDWHSGKHVPWREIGPTLIKRGRRPVARRRRRQTRGRITNYFWNMPNDAFLAAPPNDLLIFEPTMRIARPPR